MLPPGLDKKTEVQFTSTEKALLCIAALVCFFVMVVSLGTPISKGTANRQQTLAFLKELLPDRDLAPLKGSADPIAVVFHLIRSGEPDVARRAIAFADEHQLGYAFPYVIQRLDSDEPALQQAARDFLRNTTGVDRGSHAGAWRAWWRNPPRNLLGVMVGETTFALGFPAALLLAGVLLSVVGPRWRWPRASAWAALLFAAAWFDLFGLGMTRLMAKHNTCTFDSNRISYYSDHGTVLGLEDARLAGGWFVFVLIAAFVIVPCLLAGAYGKIAAAWSGKDASLGIRSRDR